MLDIAAPHQELGEVRAGDGSAMDMLPLITGFLNGTDGGGDTFR